MQRIRPLLIDIHTHLYPKSYVAYLRQRTVHPRIFTRRAPNSTTEEDRLVILADEPSSGRPVGPQYWSRDEKLKFMDKHGIDLSIVSCANPWLDFLPPNEAQSLARDLNDDLESYCSTAPSIEISADSAQNSINISRLYGFGTLPIVPGITVQTLLESVKQIASLPHLRGFIMGTRGVGQGLDDPTLEPLWELVSKEKLVIFLHPHYGLGSGAKEAWGELDNGHVLPLALGFPMETTIATTRLILAGVFDRHPDLRLLLAHSGGALPQLSSRLASCIAHDPQVASRLKHDARYYVSKLYYDAVNYGQEEMGFVGDVIGRGSAYEKAETSVPRRNRMAGSRRMLFGTDHPFFPPLGDSDEKWKSVVENLQAIESVEGWGKEEKDAVRGGNAVELFRLATN